MTQPFCSIYTKSYRQFEKDPELETAKPCAYFSEFTENFLPTEDSKDIYNAERDETLLKERAIKSFISTYQKSYCLSEGKKSMIIDPNDLDADQFIAYFNNYYKKRTQAVPRPVPTSRRVLGYCRFDHYYTGKSTYQETICREAYDYFKKDYDVGKSRLFYKKQLELRKLKGEDVTPVKETVEIKKEEEIPEKPKIPEKEKKMCAICCEKYEEVSEREIPKEDESTVKKEKYPC